MRPSLFNAPCPPELEDEVFMIETAGEMPEVALADSLANAGPLDSAARGCLQAACARGYLAIIRRDLDPALIGTSPFRGLERAHANLMRLRAFLAKAGLPEPPEMAGLLGGELAAYLKAEDAALANGRGYATCTRRHAEGLISALGLDPEPWRGLCDRLERVPALDFIGLRALLRLRGSGPCALARRREGGCMLIELRGNQGGGVLASASLGLLDARGQPDPEAEARAELVWRLARRACAQGETHTGERA